MGMVADSQTEQLEDRRLFLTKLERDGVPTINRCPVPGCGGIPMVVSVSKCTDMDEQDHSYVVLCAAEFMEFRDHGVVDDLIHPHVRLDPYWRPGSRTTVGYFEAITTAWNKVTEDWLRERSGGKNES